jgi:dCMP deaminase
MNRPSWHQTWMNIAKEIAKRSYDTRMKVGCVIVSEDNSLMLSCGYNGNASSLPNVPESLEPGQSGFIHAELNAIIKCDYNFPKKKHMYCTHSACRNCAKTIINAGIHTFIYDELYRDTSGIDLLKDCGIQVINVNDTIFNDDESVDRKRHS